LLSSSGSLVPFRVLSSLSRSLLPDSSTPAAGGLAGLLLPLPAPPPLGDARTFAWFPARLTGAGRDVLRGDADRVELLGLDRWVGGTHVTADNAWRWDIGGRRLVAPL